MFLTKSKYVEFVTCPRKAWYNKFEPITPDDKDYSRALMGEQVGILAWDYFGKGNCVLYDETNPTTNPGIYAEYLLQYENLKCYCDIVVIHEDKSIDIYEVKSVSEIKSDNREKFLEDVSFQYYVANKLNFKVNSVNLMHLNKTYVYDGENLDVKELFTYHDFTEEVKARLGFVENKIAEYFDMNVNQIPKCPFSKYCSQNEGCQYLEVCKKFKNLPLENSTYDLYSCTNRTDYIEEGLLTFDDIYQSDKYGKLSDYNKVMIDYYFGKNKGILVRKEKLQKFINEIKYPIYFFDFETCQEVIPIYANSRAYTQIPFQYSLHIMLDDSQTEEEIMKNHRYFLGDGINDPREDLIKQMIEDLGTTGSIIAYSKKFEVGRINDLIKDFPKYKDTLEKIRERFVDLEDVFHYREVYTKVISSGKRKGELKEENKPALTLIYHPDMKNSCSIKVVLPAFFPERSDLNYDNLSQVHHGGEAIEAYKKLRTLKGKEREELIDNMLKYCHLDTKAMVVLYLKFKELSK